MCVYCVYVKENEIVGEGNRAVQSAANAPECRSEVVFARSAVLARTADNASRFAICTLNPHIQLSRIPGYPCARVPCSPKRTLSFIRNLVGITGFYAFDSSSGIGFTLWGN